MENAVAWAAFFRGLFVIVGLPVLAIALHRIFRLASNARGIRERLEKITTEESVSLAKNPLGLNC